MGVEKRSGGERDVTHTKLHKLAKCQQLVISNSRLRQRPYLSKNNYDVCHKSEGDSHNLVIKPGSDKGKWINECAGFHKSNTDRFEACWVLHSWGLNDHVCGQKGESPCRARKCEPFQKCRLVAPSKCLCLWQALSSRLMGTCHQCRKRRTWPGEMCCLYCKLKWKKGPLKQCGSFWLFAMFAAEWNGS